MADGQEGKHRFDVVAALQAEAMLPPNCFTLKRFGGLGEGIPLSLARGPNPDRPWEPHILVGTHRLSRDRHQGCLFEKKDDAGLVRRARVNEVVREGKPSFYTLRNPGQECIMHSLVLASLAMPFDARVVVEGHPLHVHAGVSGTGMVLAHALGEALALIGDREEMNFLFPDGQVRKFRQDGANLVEEQLGHAEMLGIRIEDAFARLGRAATIPDEERRVRAVHFILSGMADLLSLTSRSRGYGQELRLRLLKEFFLELHEDDLGMVHRKVTAILYNVDRPLVAMLRMGQRAEAQVDLSRLAQKYEVTDERGNVADIATARAMREAKRLKRAAADEALRNRMKGPSGGKPAQTSNPKKAAKRARKAGNGKQ